MSLIGQFPWDPFPPDTPEPRGPDPMQAIAFRGAVTATDGYRSVRLALRVEGDALRVGNRFVPLNRYRQVGFLAAGNAASSMALGALRTLGPKLTQGLIAAPLGPPQDLPFQAAHIPVGWPDAPPAESVVRAVEEIGAELTDMDLFLLLLSPGALAALTVPPAPWGAAAWREWLEGVYDAGATSREIGLLVRLLGEGGVGGQLSSLLPRPDVVTLLIERGDGPAVLGGGPTVPVTPDERRDGRAVLQRLGLLQALPAAARARLEADASRAAGAPRNVARPVSVAAPSDALRGAGDALFDKKWAARLASLQIAARPEGAAQAFLHRTEEVLKNETFDPEARFKGVGVLAGTTLGVPEGVDEGPALGRFLTAVMEGLVRREMSIGLFRTSGPIGPAAFPPGAVVGTSTHTGTSPTPGRARALPMPPGLTDVGLMAVALMPFPEPK